MDTILNIQMNYNKGIHIRFKQTIFQQLQFQDTFRPI